MRVDFFLTDLNRLEVVAYAVNFFNVRELTRIWCFWDKDKFIFGYSREYNRDIYL
jgi:hypothetical protein